MSSSVQRQNADVMSANERRTRVGKSLGPYLLVDLLRAGAFVDTYVAQFRGRHGFGKTVRLRCPARGAEKSERAAAVLMSEARIGAYVQHPNLSAPDRIHESVEGLLFTTTLYAERVPLARLWEAPPPMLPLPLPLALTIGRDLCSGVHHLHERLRAGRASADGLYPAITPETVELTFEGGVVLSTFHEAVGPVEMDDAYAALVAPECRRGQRDARSDVYSIGALLYLIANGKEPQAAGGMSFDPVPTLPRGAPETLRLVLQRAMDPDPRARFSSVLELRLVLEDLATWNRIGLSNIQLGKFLNQCIDPDVEFARRRQRLAEASAADASGAHHDSPERTETTRRDPFESVPTQPWSAPVERTDLKR